MQNDRSGVLQVPHWEPPSAQKTPGRCGKRSSQSASVSQAPHGAFGLVRSSPQRVTPAVVRKQTQVPPGMSQRSAADEQMLSPVSHVPCPVMHRPSMQSEFAPQAPFSQQSSVGMQRVPHVFVPPTQTSPFFFFFLRFFLAEVSTPADSMPTMPSAERTGTVERRVNGKRNVLAMASKRPLFIGFPFLLEAIEPVCACIVPEPEPGGYS